MLLQSICLFGSLLSAMLGCITGVAVGHTAGEGPMYCGGSVGFLFGFTAGRAALGLIAHSAEAFLILWSEAS